MNEFMVVWVRDPSKGVDVSHCNIYGVRLWNGDDSTGGIIGGSEVGIDTSTGEQFYPRIATYRLNPDAPYLVIYRDNWNDAEGDIRGYLLNKQGLPVQLLNISTHAEVIESYARLDSSEERGGYAVTWQEKYPESSFNVKWREISYTGNMGPIKIVTDRWDDEGFPDVINSYPAPFIVWENHGEGDYYDIWGRFWYERTFLPAVMRK
jgi:hypothetical protein